jgi:hypothetical protein
MLEMKTKTQNKTSSVDWKKLKTEYLGLKTTIDVLEHSDLDMWGK